MEWSHWSSPQYTRRAQMAHSRGQRTDAPLPSQDHMVCPKMVATINIFAAPMKNHLRLYDNMFYFISTFAMYVFV